MKKLLFAATALAGLAVNPAINLTAQQLAFPGATGFGSFATGGRGGTVYHVTNTNDSGAGSFRDAVGTANRTVVFDVGGYISLGSAVSCANNLTIAGQTAPGDGIGIMGHEVSFSVKKNEIVRFLRIRPGSIASSSEDGINIGDGTNMIFDHISIEFAPYNNIDATGSRSGPNQITVQNSILADPIGQQFTAHTEALGNTFSWYGNLISSAHNRNPLAKINTIFINNVVYNFQAGYTVANTSGDFSHDIINNYFITGPSTTSPSDDFYQMDANQSIYSSGNLLDSDKNGALGGSAAAPSGVTVLSSPWSSLTPGIPTSSTASAYRRDVSLAGAFPHDQVDQDVLADVTSLGTSGQMWTTQTANGLGNSGFGMINGGTAPTDTDGDGMPDYWEIAMGRNLNSAADGNTVGPDGYTYLEGYLNWLAGPHATTTNTTPIDTNLSPYSGGFIASTVFTVSGAVNGTVSLNGDGHTAHFTPTGGFHGLGGYNFSVTDSAGATMTNSVAVLVQPGPPATPTGLTATAGNAQVVLGWNASAGATGYPVERAVSSGGPYTQIALTATPGYTNTALTNGTTYYYSVAASNAFGVSAFSAYAGATPVGSSAKSISLDFDGGNMAMASTESAGVVAKSNWNNLVNATGTNQVLVDETGATTAAKVTWTAGSHNSVTPITDAAGNNRMMKGYLDTSNTTSSVVTVTGLPGGVTNDVYVYFDGNNAAITRAAAYQISGTGITTTTINGTDNASTDFSGTFTQANNSAGNYVKYTITASGFTITATPVSSGNTTLRAPLNAIQIIAR